ncbi:arginine--tRNA ligase [Patescibacteria group bacterium AH-259-L05]|nr:arginine--tRNA ligase [Patescibacteria group bacterium AH-259-L05]
MNIEDIKKSIINTVQKALDLPSDFVLDLDLPPDPKMGDVSISCFEIAKHISQSPEKIAAHISRKVQANSIIQKVENVGPYINFFLKKNVWFESVLEQIYKQKQRFGNIREEKEKKIVLEYSSPNTNKPQHLGHLRNNFLGWSLAQILQTAGHKIIKVNLINDRGIHICKSMLAYQLWGNNKTSESENIKGDHFVGDYYVLFEKKVQENPELLKKAQELLEKWEKRDKKTRKLWKEMNTRALDGINQTYKKIGVRFDKVYYESKIYKRGKNIILKALKKDLCYVRDDGAVEIDLTGHGLDKKVLLRADGTSVYITQDIGLSQLRYKQFKPDTCIYVVGSEQDYHFKALFKILQVFGFEWARNCYHLSYGLISLPKGRMKSREGEVVDADDIILEMENLAEKEIIKRSPDLDNNEVKKRAEAIALSALKFYLLKFTPQQNIKFNPEESLSFEGDTGPYVQYTYARIQSILRKSKLSEPGTDSRIDYSELGNDEEIELLKQLFVYQNILARCVDEYNPAYLCTYILQLSQTFNKFYHKHHVLQAKDNVRHARLVLISAIAHVIKNSLNLLGIDVLDEM